LAQIKIVNTETILHAFVEDIILDDIPNNCRVYCFVFGPSDADETIKKDLENLGREYGNNLFVGFWSMADPRYNDMAIYFELKNLPAIVITAESSLASIVGKSSIVGSAFVRLDNHTLLSEVESLKQLVRLLYNLFITGEVAKAMKQAKEARESVSIMNILRNVKKFFTDALVKIIERYNIEFKFGLFEFKLEK
jgi:hypothetical protein